MTNTKLTITTKKKINFFQIENELVDGGHLAQIKGAALGVYLAISRHANYSTQIAFPSISLLAKETGYDKKAVISGIQKLEELGYIVKVKKGGRDAGSNHYEIQELSTIKIGEKKKKNVTPPKNPARKKKENITIPETEVVEVIPEATGVYEAYQKAIDKWSDKTKVAQWKEETLLKKIGTGNKETFEIAYSILSTDREMTVDTARVYLKDPQSMIKQLYPRIKKVINQRKSEVIVEKAKQEVREAKSTVKARALEEGIVTLEEIKVYDAMKAEGDTKNKEYKAINQKLEDLYNQVCRQIVQKHNVKIIGDIWYVENVA